MNNTKEDTTLPPFLKFFDPYAVLQPEKVGNSADSQNTDSKQDVSGSLLTLKKNANVMDVFDNLFVTPQQVSSNYNDFDEEFATFLDKYEDGKVGKLIDISESKPKSIKLYTDEDIKVLEPKLIINENVDDLIDELILEKKIEKMCLKEISYNISLNKTVPNNNFPSKIDHDINTNNFIKDVFAANTSIEFDNTPNKYSKSTPRQDSSMEPSTVISNNNEQKISHITSKLNILRPISIREISHKCKILIETVVKDPKVFKKQRKFKSEAEVFNYTKGAGLQEKSVVLPQIMERLMNRNIAYEMKKNLKNKLLLDTDVTAATKEYDISDNEFTYRREIKRKQMEEFINHQQIGDLSVNLDEYQKFNASTSKNIYDCNNVNSLLQKMNDGSSQHKPNNTNEVFTSDIQRYILSIKNPKSCHNEASTFKINEDHTMNSGQGNTTLPTFLKFFDPYTISEKVWGKSTHTKNTDSMQDISGSFLTVKQDPNVYNDTKPNQYSKHTIQIDSNMAPSIVIRNNNEPNISQILVKQNIPTLTATRENSYECKILIETVSKDPKVFKNRRIFKSEKETSKYTKGASLAEKKIVLPQIMERLKNRNIAREMKNNLQKKLLLDTGVTVATKENYTHKREIKRKQMEEFINHQEIGDLSVNLDECHKFDASISKNIYDRNNNNLLFNQSNLGPLKLKPNDTNEVFTSDIQRYILSTKKPKNCRNEASTSRINEGSKGIDSKNEILYPEVLMEDCNRQRLIEFERRRLFENFVRNGKSD